jgi:hypothetical protein
MDIISINLHFNYYHNILVFKNNLIKNVFSKNTNLRRKYIVFWNIFKILFLTRKFQFLLIIYKHVLRLPNVLNNKTYLRKFKKS